MSDDLGPWPGEEKLDGSRPAVDQPTLIKPPRESPRAEAIRHEASAGSAPELLVLAILEVSAAIDRLTNAIKESS